MKIKDNENERSNSNSDGKLKKKVSINDPHNTSLSSICDSMNNSFHARKSQEKKEKSMGKLKKVEE